MSGAFPFRLQPCNKCISQCSDFVKRQRKFEAPSCIVPSDSVKHYRMLLHLRSALGALVCMTWKLPWTIQAFPKYLNTLSVMVRKSEWNTHERKLSKARAGWDYLNFALSTKHVTFIVIEVSVLLTSKPSIHNNIHSPPSLFHTDASSVLSKLGKCRALPSSLLSPSLRSTLRTTCSEPIPPWRVSIECFPYKKLPWVLFAVFPHCP